MFQCLWRCDCVIYTTACVFQFLWLFIYVIYTTAYVFHFLWLYICVICTTTCVFQFLWLCICVTYTQRMCFNSCGCISVLFVLLHMCFNSYVGVSILFTLQHMCWRKLWLQVIQLSLLSSNHTVRNCIWGTLVCKSFIIYYFRYNTLMQSIFQNKSDLHVSIFLCDPIFWRFFKPLILSFK